MKSLTYIFLVFCCMATAHAEEMKFQAEISKLLDILINSLYTQKEIFLREAISNASDALDKARFTAINNQAVADAEAEMSIKIQADPENRQLIITDTGIGMTKSDLINNLGTIAKSGTKQFLEALKSSGNVNLIGQFGVGFYSYFLVADKVTVVSKSVDDKQHVWESEAQDSFTVYEDTEGEQLTRGTRVILHLKEDAEDYLDISNLKSMVTKYSQFINFPIYLYTSRQEQREVEIEDEPVTEGETDEPVTEEPKDDIMNEDVDEPLLDEEDKKKTKTVTETVWDWEQLNENKAIWLRPSDEIEDEEYMQFYKSISKDSEDPLDWIHFKVEGEIEFRALLFIPKSVQYNFMDPEAVENEKSRVKLYVKRVLISEDFDELMPRYFNFIQGVVDSDDLPLNVSRETLQQMKIIKTIKKKLVRKVIDKLTKYSKLEIEEDYRKDTEELSEDDRAELENRIAYKKEEVKQKYEKFWDTFGRSIKLGIVEDISNRNKLADIARFYSTHSDAEDLIKLQDYIDRKKTDQDKMYFIGGEDRKIMLSSPLLKELTNKNYEVLILDDPIDEYCIQVLGKYKDMDMINIAKAGFELPKDEDEKELLVKVNRYYQPLTDWLKTLLSEHIQTINLSLNMDDPMVVLANQGGYSAHMEKIARAQASTYKDKRIDMLNQMKKNLVINPYHPFMKELLERVKNTPDAETEENARLLFEVAMLNSGFVLKNTSKFADKFYNVMSDSLGLMRGENKVEIDLDEGEQTDEPTNTDDEAIEEITLEDDPVNETTQPEDDVTIELGNEDTGLDEEMRSEDL